MSAGMVDLVFRSPFAPGQPVELVFGDDGAHGNDVAARVAIRLPGPRMAMRMVRRKTAAVYVRLPGPRVAVIARYESRTDRPTVGQTLSGFGSGAPARASIAGVYQQAVPAQARLQVQGERAQTVGVASRQIWQQARAMATPVRAIAQTGRAVAAEVSQAWQEGRRMRSSSQQRWEEGVHTSAALLQLYQETLRRRSAAASDFTDGRPAGASVRRVFGHGRGVRIVLRTGYEEARRPVPGGARPVVPPVEQPCYVPAVGGPVDLVFVQTWRKGADLVFVCCRETAQPGAVITVPSRKVYIVLNSITLHRVDTGAELHAHSFSMSLDYQSWTWQWNASLHHDAASHLGREANGDPAELAVEVNGIPFRLLLERISRDRRFLPQQRWSVSGKGKATILSAPWAPELSFGNPTGARTAQQLALDALSINGVGIGWGIDWQLQDWLVPAGAWAFRGRYIEAINEIASAAGGYVQPHPTDAVLRILPRYPSAPWSWADVAPDFEIPEDVAEVEGTEYLDKTVYNRVFVGGVGAGVFGPITRAGTAGDVIAPQVAHALITDATAHRQRGLAELADTGRQELVKINMQVLPETGVIVPGKFVRYLGEQTVMGIVRGVSIDWAAPKLRQTLEIETHA